MSDFREELKELINRHNMENESDTPDFILADYLIGCLSSFNKSTNIRSTWYSSHDYKYGNGGDE